MPTPRPCLRAQASPGDLCLLFHLEEPCASCAPHVPDFQQRVGVIAADPVCLCGAPEDGHWPDCQPASKGGTVRDPVSP